MHGFRTSRALIIDDNPTEAMPVVHALGGLGVASLYHDAAPDADYSRKHTGIRLLFLDMVLENRGASEDDPDAAANILVGALGQLIEHSSDPLVVVCWTKYKDFKEAFKKAFERAFPGTPLENVLLLNKGDLSDPAKRETLVKAIEAAFESLRPLSLLFGWEQMVHNAATQTTSALATLVQNAASSGKIPWGDCSYQICAALALAERGSRLASEKPEHALASFYDSLTPLLADQLDHLGLRPATETSEKPEAPAPPAMPLGSSPSGAAPKPGLDPSATDGAAVPAPQAAEPKPDTRQVAAAPTDSPLLLPPKPTLFEAQTCALTPSSTDAPQLMEVAVEAPKPAGVQQGPIDAATILPLETATRLLQTVKSEAGLWAAGGSLLPTLLRADLNTMLLVSASVRSDGTCPGYIYALETGSPNLQTTKQCLTCWKDAGPDTFVINGRFPADYLPVVIEITPACDFSQDKAKLPRFVGGYIFPEAGIETFRKADYTRRVGPVLLKRDLPPKLNGVYYLALNAHFIISLNPSIAKQLKPFLRLRASVLADTVAWVTQQASRPGYTSMGP